MSEIPAFSYLQPTILTHNSPMKSKLPYIQS